MKRIVICYDGTWNTAKEDEVRKGAETNVVRFYRSILGEEIRRIPGGKAPGSPRIKTLKWYDQGVGTKWYEHVRGGAFGLGLSRNIREGYRALAAHYEAGDEIYILGFSRGAYTARSLVGLIRNAGLLKKRFVRKADPDDNPELMNAYELYRSRDENADTGFAVDFRRRHSVSPMPGIRFLGVWDTVGALGIPLKAFDRFNAGRYEFHDTELSGIVQNAFHAIAIDEHRENYSPTLWNPKFKPSQTMKQIWFCGAHADVGGGYPRQALSSVTLRWMQDNARLDGAGLEFDAEQVPPPRDGYLRSKVTDSFSEFLDGIYRLFHHRYYRPIGKTTHGNEETDVTVRRKLEKDHAYKPKNPGLH